MIQDDVYALANSYLRKVKRSGADHIVAICPFHSKEDGSEEANPSFTMSLSKGLFLCFTCQEKGSLQTFLKKVGMPRPAIERHFSGLIEALAEHRPRKVDLARKPPLSRDPMPESMLGLFDYCPLGLLEDGFKEDLLHSYDVGFDQDHMRVTYPLRDMHGALVGISGRTVVDEYPKYKLYEQEYRRWGYPPRKTDKRIVLWNFHRVYPNVFFKKKSSVILVEGFKACLWLIQHGLPDTVALLGVHLSEEQRLMLEHLGATVYLMLDNNIWGRKGTARVGAALSKSLDVKIVEYPEEKPQPSDLTPEEIESSVASAKDYFVWATEERNKKWLLERNPRI